MNDQLIGEQVHALRTAGARTLTGVVSDTGGVLRAKAVPAARIEAFARSGMGASLTWPQFCVDNGVALTEEVGVVGDLRLTADLTTARVLEGGQAWAVADVRDQEGNRSPYCWRDVVRRQVDGLRDRGVDALVGQELEFTLTDLEGRQLGAELGWPCYGAGVFGELGAFAADLCEGLDAAGVPVEQVHAEYGVGQFELSLPPTDPVAAADNVLLSRAIISQVGRRHGLRASFSPVPFAGGAGNGAHLHVSFAREGVPLLSGGPGTAVPGTEGMYDDAAAAIAGLVAHLPGAMAVLAGTVVSGDRMQPGHWSGAWSAWGLENREVAVRVLAANLGNPHGANVEVKCVDAGANPWLATGLVLGLARHGMEARLTPPPEMLLNPADLTEGERTAASVVALPSSHDDRLARFESDEVVRDVLGAALHASVLAVRRHEATCLDGQDIHAATRFAWSG